MSEDDIALDEKRMYGDKREETTVFVASDVGVTRVDVAGDQIGRFSLVYDEPATAIAGADGKLVVGTESDVLVGTGDGFAETGFGAAALVGIDDGTPIAVGENGTVARLSGDEWVTVGSVTGPRRMDGNVLATGDGIVRVEHTVVDLEAGRSVRDVAAAGPYAATGDGLYRYDGEWARVAEGNCNLVTAAAGDRVAAIAEDVLLVSRDGEWTRQDLPTDAAFADAAYGESLYAVTADGTTYVYADPDVTPDGQGGWRSRALGVRGVTGIAVP